MKISLAITFIAFCFLFFSILVSRISLERSKLRVEELHEIIDDMSIKI
jgi:hypothetical protein